MKKLHFDLTYQERMALFQKKGMKIGNNVHIDATVKIDENFCHLISIGNNCRIARETIILSHDGSIVPFTGGYGKAGKVEIKDNCIIGVRSIILPGVTIGPNALIAAGSVVNKDVPPNSCVCGCPARYYAKFSHFISKIKERIEESEYIFTQIQCIDNHEEFVKEREKMILESKKNDIYYKPKLPFIIKRQK